jgi:large subunit ribosomal protein L29
MKKNAIKELREKDVEALKQTLVERQKHVFALRTQAVTQKVENPHAGKNTRHEIARIKTILREKQLAKAKK